MNLLCHKWGKEMLNPFWVETDKLKYSYIGGVRVSVRLMGWVVHYGMKVNQSRRVNQSVRF